MAWYENRINRKYYDFSWHIRNSLWIFSLGHVLIIVYLFHNITYISWTVIVLNKGKFLDDSELSKILKYHVGLEYILRHFETFLSAFHAIIVGSFFLNRHFGFFVNNKYYYIGCILIRLTLIVDLMVKIFYAPLLFKCLIKTLY